MSVPFCFTLEILLHICRENCRTADEHPTKGNRQWNVLEIARLPLAGLQRTMQFSRIMQRPRSFAAGNFYRLDRIDGSNERAWLHSLNGLNSRSQSLAISWSEFQGEIVWRVIGLLGLPCLLYLSVYFTVIFFLEYMQLLINVQRISYFQREHFRTKQHEKLKSSIALCYIFLCCILDSPASLNLKLKYP